jgi:hypothetical protein
MVKTHPPAVTLSDNTRIGTPADQSTRRKACVQAHTQFSPPRRAAPDPIDAGRQKFQFLQSCWVSQLSRGSKRKSKWTGKEDDSQIRCTAHCQILSSTPVSLSSMPSKSIANLQHQPDRIWDAFAFFFKKTSFCLLTAAQIVCANEYNVTRIGSEFRVSM